MKPAWQHSGACAAVRGLPANLWILVLSRYQRDNLLWLLHACGFPSTAIEPFHLANTGDWLGEIAWMLAKDSSQIVYPEGAEIVYGRVRIDDDDAPNLTFDQLREGVERWLAGRQSREARQ